MRFTIPQDKMSSELDSIQESLEKAHEAELELLKSTLAGEKRCALGELETQLSSDYESRKILMEQDYFSQISTLGQQHALELDKLKGMATLSTYHHLD